MYEKKHVEQSTGQSCQPEIKLKFEKLLLVLTSIDKPVNTVAADSYTDYTQTVFTIQVKIFH